VLEVWGDKYGHPDISTSVWRGNSRQGSFRTQFDREELEALFHTNGKAGERTPNRAKWSFGRIQEQQGDIAPKAITRIGDGNEP